MLDNEREKESNQNKIFSNLAMSPELNSSSGYKEFR